MQADIKMDEFNATGEIQKLEEGNDYVLLQNLFCYQILTKDGHQVFGSYDLATAKSKFRHLEFSSHQN